MIDTAVILAAGRGTRLSSITRAIPKELLTIGNVPIIEHSVEMFREVGIKKLIVVVGYHKKAIIDYLGSGKRYGMDIAYVFQEEQLGTGNALLYAESFIDNNFCLLFGDDYLEPSNCFLSLTKKHIENSSVATVGVSKVDDASTTSVLKIENNGFVTDIVEKPEKKNVWNNMGSNGSFVLNKEIFDFIKITPPGLNGEIYISDALGLMIKKDKKVQALSNADYYMDIGIMDRFISANKRFFANYK